MKKLFILACSLLSVISTTAQIVPLPKSESYTEGEFTITDKSCLVYNSRVRDAATYLLNYLPFKQILSSQKVMDGDVVLSVNTFMEPEAYRITVD